MKGLIAYIYENKRFGRDGLSVLSEAAIGVTLVGPEFPEIFEISEEFPPAVLVKGPHDTIHIRPYVGDGERLRHFMSGGRYVGTSDSRFSKAVGKALGLELFNGAVKLHDRVES